MSASLVGSESGLPSADQLALALLHLFITFAEGDVVFPWAWVLLEFVEPASL